MLSWRAWLKGIVVGGLLLLIQGGIALPTLTRLSQSDYRVLLSGRPLMMQRQHEPWKEPGETGRLLARGFVLWAFAAYLVMELRRKGFFR